ncbi:uncharacterized protein [Amphiura filiformis]|uniref:uncharacterized protein n=1 Tax=Amphiura filiformis TaxID=82378 RepID=UPI003B222054
MAEPQLEEPFQLVRQRTEEAQHQSLRVASPHRRVSESAAHLGVVLSHLCVLEKRPDPSRGGALRWSLPFAEKCLCQRVVAPVFLNAQTCPRRKYEDGDMWFVDDPQPLTLRHNWEKDILDGLLDRTTYCVQCHTYSTNNYGSNSVQNTNFEYPWPQLPAGTTRFTVFIQGNMDAYIILSPANNGTSDDNPSDVGIPKIVIGGSGNQISGFLCNSHDNWERFDTPDILSPTEEREFFIQFVDSNLEIGIAGEAPFMSVSYSNCDVDVKYVGIATGYGGEAEWRYCEQEMKY